MNREIGESAIEDPTVAAAGAGAEDKRRDLEKNHPEIVNLEVETAPYYFDQPVSHGEHVEAIRDQVALDAMVSEVEKNTIEAAIQAGETEEAANEQGKKAADEFRAANTSELNKHRIEHSKSN